MAPLICFEDTLPDLTRKFALLQPDLFINITNDGWFNQSPQSRQHLANAVFRTIEFRRPMLRVTNSGVTVAISEKGVILQELKSPDTDSTFISGAMRGELKIPEYRETLYARWGDWIVYASMGMALLLGLTASRARATDQFD